MFKETCIKEIPVADGYTQAGSLLSNNKNKNLIICSHGLAGKSTSYLSLSIRDYIVDNNLEFDFFAFNIYSRDENRRSFFDFSLKNQVEDTKKLIEYFSDKYEKIYLIGISYSGLANAMLNSDKIEKQVLLDPSLTVTAHWEHANLKAIDEDTFISFDKNVPMVLKKSLIDEGLARTPEKAQEILNNIKRPTFITLTDSIYTKQTLLLDLSNPNIKYKEFDTNHSFTTVGATKELMPELFKFFG